MNIAVQVASALGSRVVLRCLFCMVAMAAFVPQAEAGAKRKPSVLYIHTDGSSPTYVADVKDKLLATGLFAAVDTFDGGAGTPTFAQLSNYDAAMVCNDTVWSNRIALGTVLAQYVDAGYGVVQTIFATAGLEEYNLLGGWTAGYNCIVYQPSYRTGAQTLGTIPNPNHPIVMGVDTFSGGSSSFRPAFTTLTAGATLVASWSDGYPLVAVGPKINRADLGFYPVSSDVRAGSWDPSTDGVKLMANALLYVMRPKVLLVAADTANFVADVRTKIRSTNIIGVVDTFDASLATPTLSELQKYDAVMTWSDLSYANTAAIGNVLADYVDSGGGVVSAPFANAFSSSSFRPGGRWITGGYEIIPGGSGYVENPQTLGTVTYSGHPTMNGVALFFSSTSSIRPVTTSLNAGGLVVAKWTDGKTLVAVSSRFPNRADLGFFPPSATVLPGAWSAASDGAKLMANALLYTARPYIACVAADSTVVGDIVAKLTASRRFSGVGNIDADITTPSLATLAQYNAIATWSQYLYVNPIALGNTLADFQDLGGGVVTAVFGNTRASVPPGGRWITQGYEVVPSPLPNILSSPPASLGAIVEPGHPIATFVRKFDGGVNSFRAATVPPLRGRTILKWSDGKMLASVHNFRKRADLGFWPPSNNGGNNGWNQRTDGTWLMANALEFAVRAKPCPGDLNGDDQVDDSDFVLFADYYNALIEPRGDLNGDAMTEDSDFVIFAGSYDALVCP